jgi:hypothetical protein
MKIKDKLEKDLRRKYIIDNSVIDTIKNSTLKVCDIQKTNLGINKSTIYRYINKDQDIILYNTAIKLAEFYGYEPIFTDDVFMFGKKVTSYWEKVLKHKQAIKLENKITKLLSENTIDNIKSINIEIKFN